MKTLLFISLLYFAFQQEALAQDTGALNTAYETARKIRVSLSLDSSSIPRLFNINMQVYLQKTGLPAGSPQIQAIEHYRDSACHQLMTDSTYQLYLQRKQTLLSGN